MKDASKTKAQLIVAGPGDWYLPQRDDVTLLGFRNDVVLKSYPECNHLFVEGQGKSTPAEYQTPGHVAGKVIQDIAEWIGKQ